MHIRAQNLDIFAAACTFDATGTMAGATFEHIERIGGDLAGLCVVAKRVMGKSYGKFASLHTRRDGRYTCFDMPDGSILAVDFGQAPGPWLVAVESRTAWELLQGREGVDLPLSLWAYESETYGDRAVA